MKLDLRCNKFYDRFTERMERTMAYLTWVYSKPMRKRYKWIHWFNGESRPFSDYKVAGYIGRKRQIAKCFMKGWC